MKIKKPKRQDNGKPTVMDMAEALDEVVDALNLLSLAAKQIVGQRLQRRQAQINSEPSK